ncbi:ABC transporter permease [Chloroflexota bacterium]
MTSYIIRRLLLMIPTLLLASLIVFFIIRFIPGDIIDIMAAESPSFTPVDRDAIEQSLGLDQPIIIQYGRWIGFIPQADGSFSGILQGDLGTSLWIRTPVVQEILIRWPTTFQLGIMSLIIAQLIALPIGIYSAVRQDTWGDYVTRSFAILCIAIPSFWLATVIIIFSSIWWGYSPPLLFVSFADNPIDSLKMFILPALIMGSHLAGITMRMMRTMLLEVLRQDYIRTAWAKGLRESMVVMRHAMKNALIPVITTVGVQLQVLVGGTVIIEAIFGLPGIGRLLIDATGTRDYPVVSGVMIVFGAVMVLINLMVDLTYGFLDPRIRYK